MELNVKLDPMAYLPDLAHPTDAGLDLGTPHDVLVMPGVGAVVDTGVHIQLYYVQAERDIVTKRMIALEMQNAQ